jgi:undecaprenyl-diphosphatase
MHPAEADLDMLHPVDTAYPAWLELYLAWEGSLAMRLNQLNHYRAVSIAFGGISRLGDGVFWYVLMALLLIVNGAGALETVLVMALTGLSGTLLYKALKGKTRRVRPCQRHSDIHLTTQPLDVHSFPSGHTLHAVCFSLIAVHYYPSLLPLLLLFTILVALSRLILGLHYLSDVLAATLIGACLALIGLNLATLV